MGKGKAGVGRAVVLPATLAALGFGFVGLFLSTFLGDEAALALGLGAAWVSFTLGRVFAHIDRPRGRGLFLRHVLTGTAFGFAGLALLNALFRQGPGWPWTPWWVLLLGFGFGLLRSHRALLPQSRGDDEGEPSDAPPTDDAPRWLGIFHRQDVEALVALLVGYGLTGLAAFLLFRAFSGFIPGSARLLSIAIAVYALQGARYLLKFASEERAARGKGVVAWLKANALQNTIVALLLIAYVIFRGDLAGMLPFFPLVEFGLGIAVFGFVLARLRGRLRRDGAELATASRARDHERVVTELREFDYDAVARPVTRFVESGAGQAEYATVVTASLPPDDARGRALRARIAEHREPLRTPPLDLEWSLLAGTAMTLGLALAAIMLAIRVFHADMPYPLFLGLMFLAFGVYAQQDTARAHHRPRLATAIAAGGTALLLLDFLLLVAEIATLASLPRFGWAITFGVVAIMIGIPALAGWRLEKRMRSGGVRDGRVTSPARELAQELQRTRKRAAVLTFVALLALMPLPWLADWLAGRSYIPSGFPPFLRDVLAVAIWVLAAFGASALVRSYGLTRVRPVLLAREKAKRERRLTLHRDIMSALERA